MVCYCFTTFTNNFEPSYILCDPKQMEWNVTLSIPSALDSQLDDIVLLLLVVVVVVDGGVDSNSEDSEWNDSLKYADDEDDGVGNDDDDDDDDRCLSNVGVNSRP